MKELIAQAKNGSISELDLSNQQIDQELRLTINALQSPKSKVTSLNLSFCGIGLNVIHLANALPSLNLISLNLSENNIKSFPFTFLANALKKSKIKKLILYRNTLENAGAAYLADTLYSCHLTYLDISDTNIGALGITYIATAIHPKSNPNCKLTHLNLGCNSMDAKAIKAIAATITTLGCTIRFLNLSFCDLEPGDIKELAIALRNPNCKLVYLGLLGNEIDTDTEEANDLTAALVSNYNILSLGIIEFPELNKLLNRNKEIFIKNCRKVLNGESLTAEEEIRVLDQCEVAYEEEDIISESELELDELYKVIIKINEKLRKKEPTTVQQPLPNLLTKPATEPKEEKQFSDSALSSTFTPPLFTSSITLSTSQVTTIQKPTVLHKPKLSNER